MKWPQGCEGSHKITETVLHSVLSRKGTHCPEVLWESNVVCRKSMKWVNDRKLYVWMFSVNSFYLLYTCNISCSVAKELTAHPHRQRTCGLRPISLVEAKMHIARKEDTRRYQKIPEETRGPRKCKCVILAGHCGQHCSFLFNVTKRTLLYVFFSLLFSGHGSCIFYLFFKLTRAIQPVHA